MTQGWNTKLKEEGCEPEEGPANVTQRATGTQAKPSSTEKSNKQHQQQTHWFPIASVHCAQDGVSACKVMTGLLILKLKKVIVWQRNSSEGSLMFGHFTGQTS